MHLADAFIQSDLTLHSSYSFFFNIYQLFMLTKLKINKNNFKWNKF